MNICYLKNKFNYISLLKEFIHENINIYSIDTLFYLKQNDILIINREQLNNIQLKNISNVLIWEDIFQGFYNYSIEMYIKNYDYYYLKYSLAEAISNTTETIIVGSSYARFGIAENLINKPCVNLSLPSQDIYYSCLIGKYIIDNNSNIKQILIGASYYYFYSDLSSSKGAELSRIKDVYYPLFHEKHNCQQIFSQKQNLINHTIFNVEHIVDYICKDLFSNFFNKSYFHDMRDRYKMKQKFDGLENYNWCELTETVKKEFSYHRALVHNKSLKYKNTYLENIKLLDYFLSYCNDKNIEVYILTFPGHHYYNSFLSNKYKNSFVSALESLNGKIHLWDFNDLDIFSDEDFVDTDHFSIKGALKATNIVNQLL